MKGLFATLLLPNLALARLFITSSSARSTQHALHYSQKGAKPKLFASKSTMASALQSSCPIKHDWCDRL